MKKRYINWKAILFCLLLLVEVALFFLQTGQVFAETNSVTIGTTINSIPSSSLPTMSHHAYSSGLSPIDSSLLFLMGVTSYAIGTLLLLEKNIYWLFSRRSRQTEDFQSNSALEPKVFVKREDTENIIERTKREIDRIDDMLLPVQKPVAL